MFWLARVDCLVKIPFPIMELDDLTLVGMDAVDSSMVISLPFDSHATYRF
jgi:hypothetical protein